MAKLYTITLNGVTEETYNKATDYIQDVYKRQYDRRAIFCL